MDNRPIGVFDSGLGGLTAVRQLTALLPAEDVIYFGDTGRVPYGTRSPETIEKYVIQDCRFLERFDVKMIIAACGTASSVAPHVLEGLAVPAIGAVKPAAAAALAATKTGRIGVIGTAATARTDVFRKLIQAADPNTEVITAACPLFVPLVENGWIDPGDEIVLGTAKRYLLPLREQGIDTLILGCTHFPLLAPVIAAVMGEEVTLIDAGKEAALVCEKTLRERELLKKEGTGSCRFFVSDRPDDFTAVASMFLGREVSEEVEQVTINNEQ